MFTRKCFLSLILCTALIIYFVYNNYLTEKINYKIILNSNLHWKYISCQNTSSTNKYENCLTIVTAFFYITKSKHDIANYKQWMSNFLSRIDTPITIFTQPSYVSYILSLRKGRPTHFIVYDEIWDLPWLKQRDLNETYQNMHKKDPEINIHSPELYAIWNSKPWMLARVSEFENVFRSTFFYWMDIGSVRVEDHKLKNFPDKEKAIKIFGDNIESENFRKFNVFAVSPFHGYKKLPEINTFKEMDLSFVIGGFFGGTVLGINWFAKAFYSIHDQLLEKGYFVGKDQNIYNFMATQYSDDILVVCVCQEKNEGCGNPWFYFQDWYSTKNESVGNEGKCQTSPLNNMTHFLLQMKQ